MISPVIKIIVRHLPVIILVIHKARLYKSQGFTLPTEGACPGSYPWPTMVIEYSILSDVSQYKEI